LGVAAFIRYKRIYETVLQEMALFFTHLGIPATPEGQTLKKLKRA